MNTSKVIILLWAIILLNLSANIYCKKNKKLNQQDVSLLKPHVIGILQRVIKFVNQLIPGKQKIINNIGIAFEACNTEIQRFTRGTRLKFTSASYNEGGHYDADTSVYTCPYEGIYQFSINLLSDIGKRCAAGIRADGWDGARAISWTTGTIGKYIQASNSLTFWCKKGQKVWVEGGTFAKDSMVYGDKRPFRCVSTFSGKLYTFADGLLGNAGVAFESCTTSSQHFEPGNRLKFALAVFRVNESYNTTDNTFTCPVKGTYQFSMNLLSENEEQMIAILRAAGWTQPRGEVMVVPGTTFIQASNTIIFECETGQKVWVEGAPNAGKSEVYGDKFPYRCLSTFSGKLLEFPNGAEMPSGRVNTVDLVKNTFTAFQACATSPQNFSRGQQLFFIFAAFNKGSHYSTATSTYTCPVHGLYQFSITLVSGKSRKLSAGIITDGWEQVRGEVWITKSTNRHVQASNSAMFICRKGQQVWVEGGIFATDDNMFGDNIQYRCLSTFSGLLLAEI